MKGIIFWRKHGALVGFCRSENGTVSTNCLGVGASRVCA